MYLVIVRAGDQDTILFHIQKTTFWVFFFSLYVLSFTFAAFYVFKICLSGSFQSQAADERLDVALNHPVRPLKGKEAKKKTACYISLIIIGINFNKVQII